MECIRIRRTLFAVGGTSPLKGKPGTYTNTVDELCDDLLRLAKCRTKFVVQIGESGGQILEVLQSTGVLLSKDCNGINYTYEGITINISSLRNWTSSFWGFGWPMVIRVLRLAYNAIPTALPVVFQALREPEYDQ